MAESHNERELRQAIVRASQHLGRIATALEALTKQPPPADDDGPDPVEHDCRVLLLGTGHGHALTPGAEKWGFDPGTRHVVCLAHEEPLYVGWLDA